LLSLTHWSFVSEISAPSGAELFGLREESILKIQLLIVPRLIYACPRIFYWRVRVVRYFRPIVVAFAIVLMLCSVSNVMAQQFPESTYQELRWRMIGPFRGGRTRALAGVPSQPNVFYIGVVNGGVWKSNDYGRTWMPIFDSQPTQSIGAIAIAPSDPNTIYVASGEGLARPDLSVGNGIYKSTDAGKTWTHLGLRDGQQIPGLAVDPRDPNRLLAAVLGHPYGPSEERGIYLSTDGGQNWTKVLSKNQNTGGDQVEFDPSNPEVAYASMWSVRQGPWEDNNEYQTTDGGLFKSTDGGKTWRPLTNGLPDKLIQIHFAIAQSQPSRLYAVAGTKEPGEYGSGKGLGIYRSDDSGEAWTRATEDGRPAMRIGGGDLPMLGVDPKNPDVVYSTSIVTVRSTDGARTWTSIRGAPGGDDYQNIWINPLDPKIILIVSDQGAIVTVNRGETWSSWYNQPTAQMYHVSVSNEFPYKVCGGQQESGSVCTLSRGNDGEITFRDWHPIGAIEYGYVAPDPLNPDIIYGAGRNEVSKYHWSTGQVQNVSPIPLRDPKFRTDRTQPIMFSPVDPHVLYTTANFLFKSTDGGNNWETISPDLTREHPGIPPSVGDMVGASDPKDVAKAEKQRGVIYALAPSFRTEEVLWVGTDDGYIWNTRDGGKNWSNITPPELTPWSKVTQISASHFDNESAYASVSRFRIDDLKPYIYRTHDSGKTWQLIVDGLPDNAPVDTVREDPVRKGLLFAGTETSVWVSFDDGDHWQPLQLNLPHTSMRDLWIYEDDLIVATHGRSFWILDDISPLRQLSESLEHANAALFKPAPAYRVRRSTYTDTPLPPDEPSAQNPPNGAIIDYFLAQRALTPVTIEIVDSQGKVARKFSSDDKPDQTEEEISKQLIPLYWIRPQKILSIDAGMHRWLWDLHYPSPVAMRHEYPISAVPHDTPRYPLGPRALPGIYTVKFTVSGASFSAPLTVRMDPRVKTSPEGLRALFTMQTNLADKMTRSSEAVSQARAVQEQLKKLSDNAKESTKDAIEALDKKLSALLEAAPEPLPQKPPAPGQVAVPPAPAESTLAQVAGNIAALYAEIDRADVAPTPAQDHALVTIERDLAAAMKRWDALRSSDIPSLNRQLKSTGLPELTAESNIRIEEESGGDEE
jgi:photosystem II stability/assembly factor-like uncharacterized protein